MAALSLAGQLIGRGQSLQHAQASQAMRHGALAHLVDVLVTRRVEAVQEGFREVLGQYAEQARHLMAQQKDYADKELETADPLRRIELRSRIQTVDTELALLRTDARLLFDRMCEIIHAMGGVAAFGGSVAEPLLLPGAMR